MCKKNKIKYIPEGFSYVNVTLQDCLLWGGFGICDSCNKGPFENLKLIYVLHDTYCNECFNKWVERTKKYSNEDILYDLNIQKNNDVNWYKLHNVI